MQVIAECHINTLIMQYHTFSDCIPCNSIKEWVIDKVLDAGSAKTSFGRCY